MSPDELKGLLQAAVELELSTIPPYLCALYTIDPVGNDEAKLVIRSVVVEEMLHMVLAANVLNAIGGEPKVAADHAPRYPHELPEGVVLHLLPFSPEAVDAFCTVENPDHAHEPLDPEHPLLAGRRVEHQQARCTRTRPATIGAFYREIVEGLEAAAAEIGEEKLFCGDPARQVGPEYYYAGGGGSLVVTDLASAKGALEEIVEQGEGDMGSMFDDDGDLAHYYRFMQLKHGRNYLGSEAGGDPAGEPVDVDYASALPMLANLREADYEGHPELQAASAAVNRTWSELLLQIETAFNGRPDALLPAVPNMFKLRDQALVLLANPMPGHPGRNAGPTFEWDPDARAYLELPL